MKSIREQMCLVDHWIIQKTVWSSAKDESITDPIGSTGSNKIIGFLQPKQDGALEISIIYRHRNEALPGGNQLSSLLFSEWIKNMRITNQGL
ncbi:hypothetical protein [Ewingella americana]